MLSISEAGKKVGLSIATIRYYDELGMIPSIRKNDYGQRLFDDESICWLEGIKFLRDLKMPIPEISNYIKLCQKNGTTSLKKRHAILMKQQSIAEQEVLDAQKRLHNLKYRIQFENEVLKGRKKDSLSPARRFNQ